MTRAWPARALLLVLLAAQGAFAQGVGPSAVAPAAPVARATAAPAGNAGSTIVGDRDTAIGLTFTPWKDEGPATFDRPPIRFDEAPAMVDTQGQARRIQGEDAISGYRRSRTELAR